MIIRKINKGDFTRFYDMQKELDNETKFMMYEPGERPMGEENFYSMVEWFDNSNSCMLVVINDNIILGVIAAERGSFIRTKHVASISTGVLMKYRNQGIGSKLFMEIEKWAKGNGITRLELTVMCHNENAIKLYKKAGFEIEGKKVHGMKIDGEYVDEYYMAKLI